MKVHLVRAEYESNDGYDHRWTVRGYVNKELAQAEARRLARAFAEQMELLWDEDDHCVQGDQQEAFAKAVGDPQLVHELDDLDPDTAPNYYVWDVDIVDLGWPEHQ